jgi:uncharacterized protein YqgV (UPF0045/DUF77 family)
MINASAAIQVLPKIEDGEVIAVVDKVIEYLKSTGLNVFVGPSETSIEGDFDQLMDIMKECSLICVREGASAVSSYIKIMYNPTFGVLSIDEKTTKHHAG